MSNHEESPELTQQAQAAYRAGCLSASFSATPPANTDRRYLSAFLRQVIKGAGIWRVSDEFPRVIVVEDLEAIAANLHSPPPPPPTLAEAREADLSTPAGRDVVRDFLATLGEGVQP